MSPLWRKTAHSFAGHMEEVSFLRPARRRSVAGALGPVYAVFEPMQSPEHTLVQLFNFHNEQAKRLLAWSTLKHYYVTQRYLIGFMREFYGVSDVHLTKLDYGFISGFEQFLYGLTPRDQRHALQMNGIMKHLTRVKKMINLAVNLDWLVKDPFKNFKLRRALVDKSFLNQVELRALEET